MPVMLCNTTELCSSIQKISGILVRKKLRSTVTYCRHTHHHASKLAKRGKTFSSGFITLPISIKFFAVSLSPAFNCRALSFAFHSILFLLLSVCVLSTHSTLDPSSLNLSRKSRVDYSYCFRIN